MYSEQMMSVNNSQFSSLLHYLEHLCFQDEGMALLQVVPKECIKDNDSVSSAEKL